MNNQDKYQYVKKATELTLFIARLKKQMQIGGPGLEENGAHGIDLLYDFMNGDFIHKATEFLWHKKEGNK
jgi:hypothetical protein